ncbi:MAG: DNA oxidative demethylase AlkB [Vicinamibacteria bacterium]|nr:DNA oxidative demethylase AlkB [Vicinamibacteria bacterium]
MKARGFTGSLFDEAAAAAPRYREALAPGAVLLRGFALDAEKELRKALDRIVASAPFRHMVTPGGYRMSVAMTNCGEFGWITDRRGYRYDALDPESGKPWPKLPAVFLDLASRAATAGGYPGFVPDACLINRYEPGARLSLHQDRNEKDFDAPIVSVSLGLPATFLFGGNDRSDRPRRVPIRHGDVAVWGGPSRLAFHGIAPLKEAKHETMGRQRINLTLRRAR